MVAEDWPTITPESIATLQLADCVDQLTLSSAEPLRLAQAAKSAHLALQAALTAALAGGMGIGAYNEKVEAEWLSFLQNGGPQPKNRYIMCFDDLLAKARSTDLEWTGRPLEVSDNDVALLQKLTWIRHGIEHVHPGFWVIEPAYIRQVIPLATSLAIEALMAVCHHLKQGQLDQVKEMARRISLLCKQT